MGAAPDDEDAMTAAAADLEQLEAAINTVLGGKDVDLELRVHRLDGSGRRGARWPSACPTAPDEL